MALPFGVTNQAPSTGGNPPDPLLRSTPYGSTTERHTSQLKLNTSLPLTDTSHTLRYQGVPAMVTPADWIRVELDERDIARACERAEKRQAYARSRGFKPKGLGTYATDRLGALGEITAA